LEDVPLHTQILEDLGSKIVHGVYPEGTVFRAEDLVEKYGASRTVVLHAVRGLELMGLLSTRRRVGLTVKPESKWMVYDPRIVKWRLSGPHQIEQLMNFVELRTCYEPFAARLCAERSSREVGFKLRNLAQELSNAAFAGEKPDYSSINRIDADYHCTILDGTDNYMIAALAGTTRAVIEGRMQYTTLPERANENTVRAHMELAQAILDRDADTAERVMTQIINAIPDELKIGM
jgi:DNA-binding FadR family transcriptional regulator